ncbi:MAG: c-type cytochrome [Pseudomonadota bacterium]
MSAYEINKFVGAILAALVFVMGLSVLSDIIFTEEPLDEPAYAIVIPEAQTEVAAEEPAETPFSVLLASADASSGKRAAAICSACHAFEAEENKLGPHLVNIVGRDIASVDGFGYSSALAGHGDGKQWSYDELNGFLENPGGWVPGTSMGYAGIKDDAQRADVIAYLVSVSPDAPPLPEPPAGAVDVAAVDTADTATDAAPAAIEEAPAAAPAEEAPAEEAAAPAAPAEEAPAEETAAVEPAPAAAEPAPPEAETAASGADPFTQLVASADPAAGEAAAALCMACHSVQEGGPHMLGPNLHGVFGADIAAKSDFGYSGALEAYGEAEGAWTIDTLNAFLIAPMETVAGTRMAFGGVKDDAERAAIIAWLHALSPNAGPLVPAPPAAEPIALTPDAAPEAPAADEAPTEATADEAADDATADEAAVEEPAPADDTAAAADEAAPQEDASAAPSEDVPARAASNVTIEPAQEARIEIVDPVREN